MMMLVIVAVFHIGCFAVAIVVIKGLLAMTAVGLVVRIRLVTRVDVKGILVEIVFGVDVVVRVLLAQLRYGHWLSLGVILGCRHHLKCEVWCFDGSVVDVVVAVWKEGRRRERKEESVDVNALFLHSYGVL